MTTVFSAPIIGISRHRLAIDGKGVTTLVAFHGCPLHCQYCLNPDSINDEIAVRVISVDELLEQVIIDNLYFLATGGGITFGGGEPYLRSEFIECFCQSMPKEWNITIETSLNVDRSHLERLLPYIDNYIIDIKDINPEIYLNYTTKSNRRMLGNLKWLSENVSTRNVIVRLPLIKGYNTKKDVALSKKRIKEMGYTCFDEFEYIIR